MQVIPDVIAPSSSFALRRTKAKVHPGTFLLSRRDRNCPLFNEAFTALTLAKCPDVTVRQHTQLLHPTLNQRARP